MYHQEQDSEIKRLGDLLLAKDKKIHELNLERLTMNQQLIAF